MQKLAAMKDKIAQLPLEQQAELLELMSELEDAENKVSAKDDFISFVNIMWPSFISGRHHKTMAEAFERVAKGELKRLLNLSLLPSFCLLGSWVGIHIRRLSRQLTLQS